MGIGFVLFVYFIVLSIAATGGSILFAAATRWYLRGVSTGRKRVMMYAAGFPFACVVFAGLWFIAYAVIEDVVFHQDPSIGDGWYAELGDGYAISMIDVTDYGTVQIASSPNAMDGSAGLSGVRRMQVAGKWIFGFDDKSAFPIPGLQQEPNIFFAIDTQSHAEKEFATESDLAAFARQNGVELALKPIADVYRQHRNTWFDGLAAILLILIPAAAFVLLLRRIYRFKREGLTDGASNANTEILASPE